MKNRIWSVIQHEITETLRRRSYLAITFVLPILAVLVVAAITLLQGEETAETPDQSTAMPAQPVGYVDQSGLLDGPGPFAGSLIPYPDQTAARAAIQSGQISGYYLIPPDYLTTGQVTRYAEQINIIESDMGLFNAFLKTTLLSNETPEMAARLQNPANIIQYQPGVNFGEETQQTQQQGSGMDLFWLVYLFGMLMMLTTFLTAGQLTQSVINEKENRVMEIVLSSLRPLQLMAGKIAGQGLMGLLQVITWLAAVLLIVRLAEVNIPMLSFLSAAELPPSLLFAVLIFFVLGFALFGAFAAGVGAISTSMREGPQYAVIYSMPAAMSIIFLPNIANDPNSTLAHILSFFPLTAPIAMIERMVVTAVPFWQVALSILLLALSVVAALLMAARLFQINNLLSGQLPTRQELLQLLVHG